MVPRWILLSLGLFLAGVVLLPAADPKPAPPGRDEWKYDVVELKTGASFKGLVVSQNKESVLIRCIVRHPGRTTRVIPEFIETEKIERLVLLDPQERDRIQKRLEALRNEYLRLSMLKKKLKGSDPGIRPEHPVADDAVSLKSVPWPHNSRTMALSYDSAHFRLLSDCCEEVVHLAAIHLEQVYAAYALFAASACLGTADHHPPDAIQGGIPATSAGPGPEHPQ